MVSMLIRPKLSMASLVTLLSVGAAAAPLRAQDGPPADTLAGLVIAPDSTPIRSAQVTAVGEDGRVAETRTDARGQYLLIVQSGGNRYALTVRALGYVPLSAVVQRRGGERRFTRDLRLNRRVVALDTLHVEPRRPRGDPLLRRGTPGEAAQSLNSLSAESFVVDPGDLAAVAALTPGVVATGAGGALSIAAQAPEQNHTTVDGASYEGASLPTEGVRSVATLVHAYDVALGQFSGGAIAARTIGGTNVWGGALTLRLLDPSVRYGDLPENAFGSRNRHLSASGGGGGALLRDRLFVFGALDLSGSSGPGTFLGPADTAALRRSGIAADSLARLRTLVRQLGFPVADEATQAANRYASSFARFDYVASDRHSLTTRVDWRGSRQTGIGASLFQLTPPRAERENSTLGVLAQLTSTGWPWSNELRLYATRGSSQTHGMFAGPAAQVRVSSMLGTDSTASATISFGAPAFWVPDERRTLVEMANETAWEAKSGVHRLKAGLWLQRETRERAPREDQFGLFTFNSLGDLERGRPASFARTFGLEPADASVRHAALFLGDAWKLSEEAEVIYGLRLEHSAYGDRPQLALAADSLLQEATAGVPSETFLSPRIGFQYRTHWRGKPTLSGGFGAFRGVVPLPSLVSTWRETGNQLETLQCNGLAAPVPDWRSYAADPRTVPTTCADAAPVYADLAAPVAVYARSFGAPRTWRASLGLRGSLVARLGYQVTAAIIRGENLPSVLDRNFDPAPAFRLSAEGHRPIYAAPEQINPATGLAAPGAARLVPGLGTVREAGSHGESWTEQLSAGVTGSPWKGLLLSTTYTFTRSRERAVGWVTGAETDPALLDWAPAGLDRPHSLQLILSRLVHPGVRLTAVGQFASGLPYTPRVLGDINADGELNDRAFIFNPNTAADAAVGRAMRLLLDEAPEAVAACLRSQFGRVAARNSCRGPAWSSLNLQAEISTSRLQKERRLSFTITAANLGAGIDYLLHGPVGLHGWGQFSVPDATLLAVRGFDPVARAYTYEVNTRFGRSIGGGLVRLPFQLVLQGRVTVGSDPRYQPMAALVSSSLNRSAGPAQFRAKLAERVRNVPATLLALDAREPGELALTPAQVERLRAAADSLEPRVLAALDALSGAFAQRGAMTPTRRAAIGEAARDAELVLEQGVRILRETLSDEQWTKLPEWLTAVPAALELQHPPPIQFSLPVGE